MRILQIISTLFLSLVLVAQPIAAQNINLSQIEDKGFVDVRKDKSSTNLYMFIFFARDKKLTAGSLAGHAYVAALKFRNDTESFVTKSVFGLYPKKTVWHLGNLPGKIALTSLDQKPGTALFVWVNRKQYDKAISIRDKWKKKGTWNAFDADCVSMMAAVAKAVGLKVPKRKNDFPYTYLQKLKKAN